MYADAIKKISRKIGLKLIKLKIKRTILMCGTNKDKIKVWTGCGTSKTNKTTRDNTLI